MYTKLAYEAKNVHYWERLRIFKLYSNQRRMERYKIFYIWKSINGHVPDIGLKWKEKGNYKLIYPRTYGSKGIIRTRQKSALNWEGIKLFNSLPLELRSFKGSKNAFKNTLDRFLEQIPDQPEVDNLKAGARNLNRDSSNSIADWIRCLHLSDHEFNDEPEGRNSNSEEGRTMISANSEDSISSNITDVCLKGSGPSPDHCQ